MCTRRTSLSTQIFLVTELCIGSLDMYLMRLGKKSKPRVRGPGMVDMTDELFWKWMVETAEGMVFIHSKQVIHRDLKPHNIFVCSDGHVKIGDFGLSRVVRDQNGSLTTMTATLTTNLGTPSYMAPELLSLDTSGVRISGEAADVYAFGIILNAMWRKRTPFNASQFPSILIMIQEVARGMRPDIPDGCPGHLVELMERCWDPDPRRRPNFTEIIQLLRTRSHSVDYHASGNGPAALTQLRGSVGQRPSLRAVPKEDTLESSKWDPSSPLLSPAEREHASGNSQQSWEAAST
jgi:serine/threonine protein kinase